MKIVKVSRIGYDKNNVLVLKQGKHDITIKGLYQQSKEIYSRYYSLLLFPCIASHNVMIDELIHCQRPEYSICFIQHTETENLHYHFIIGFTGSYNQKKSLYQVLNELNFFKDFVFNADWVYADIYNHIEPVSFIKEGLLYLVHKSKKAISDCKKPYSFDFVNYGKNGNTYLYEKLFEILSNENPDLDGVDWSCSDCLRYVYYIMDVNKFVSQIQLQRYILNDSSITESQRNKVFYYWRTFIFALENQFNINKGDFDNEN